MQWQRRLWSYLLLLLVKSGGLQGSLAHYWKMLGQANLASVSYEADCNLISCQCWSDLSQQSASLWNGRLILAEGQQTGAIGQSWLVTCLIPANLSDFGQSLQRTQSTGANR